MPINEKDLEFAQMISLHCFWCQFQKKFALLIWLHLCLKWLNNLKIS